MDQADVRLSGRITVKGDGSAKEDKFTIRASSSFAKGGRITLTARPGFRPDVAVDKDGLRTNVKADALSSIASIDDYDLEVSKSTEIMGQACDMTLSMENVGRGGAPALKVKTNVEKVGDVTLTLARRGNKGSNDDKALGQDMCRVCATLPMEDLLGNKDLTASVDYDINSKNANVHVGYKNGDVKLKLRSTINTGDNSMTHKVNADYSGIEGVGIGVQVNDKVEGHVAITKDRYEIRVPVTKSGVNANDVTLRMTWSHDM
eukprot:CAMPEP_0197583620 /NCGR_PEP_ID=MMETSP1326-20131121/6479_1 /TAXON_ID=1155430 /ORGANISM="Genus nov. species nov., Strain RCC2288" /LENGTH=260 /DNA_ID=CAMNT_0043147865 /DNA_START=107 /DNA_END=889 /DNA_ORIENTATION=+